MRRAFVVVAIALTAVAIGLASGGSAAPRSASGDAATFGPVALPAMPQGATVTVDVPITNIGTSTWTSPPVYLSYHWYVPAGGLIEVVWDGERTALGAAIAPGDTRTIAARVTVPATPRSYVLSFELVREGVAWFGSPVEVPALVGASSYRAAYSAGAGASAPAGAVLTLPLTVVNTGTATWSSTESAPVFLSYHVYDASGGLVVWDGLRTPLGAAIAPGQSRALRVAVQAPAAGGDYVVRVDAVREGVAWFSELGSPGADVTLRIATVYGAIDAPDTMWAGAFGAASVTLTNTTATTWRSSGTAAMFLSYHVYASGGPLLVWDGVRSALPYDVAPGESVVVAASLRATASAGDLVFAWDLVQEGIAWLSSRGVEPATDLVTVRALPSSLVGAEWSRIPTSDRVVALTFDCGANADGAQKILDTLAAKDVPATFFMCGSFVNAFPDTARAIASRYPVGNHTMTHPDLRTLSDTDALGEILAGERAIRSVTGVDPHPLFRFPYGGSDARTIAIANSSGYGGIRWTVDTLGWQGTSGGQSVATVTSRVLSALQPGGIVLMHVGSNPDDRSTLDADALAGLIDQIRAQGYRLVTISQYIP